MPWIPIYADEKDILKIFEILGNNDECAFIVQNGPGKWIAKYSIDYVNDGRYCIWHIPGGPLPLITNNNQDRTTVIDPWNGWNEIKAGADSTSPYFGAGHPGIIWLNARTSSKRKIPGIGLSSFEWIGNHYRIIGKPASTATEGYWKILRKTLSKSATKVPRSGPLDGEKAEILALPNAYVKLRNGWNRDENP